jgi:DNA-binding MarR family transcriptional regulator
MNEPTVHDKIAHLGRTCACINLRRTARAITNYYDKLFREACGLRATQITPLVVLYLAGPQTINEIAGRLELDRTTLTRNLKLLEEASLLQIQPGDDQRTRMVTLTEHGTSVLLKALPVWEEAQAHVVQGIGAEQFRALLSQLSDIAELTRES